MVGTGLLRDTGRAASPGIIMTTGSVLQMAFGPFLIFGLLGFPALGVEGAAWSYVAARSLTFFATAYLLVIRDRLIILSLETKALNRPISSRSVWINRDITILTRNAATTRKISGRTRPIVSSPSISADRNASEN